METPETSPGLYMDTSHDQCMHNGCYGGYLIYCHTPTRSYIKTKIEWVLFISSSLSVCNIFVPILQWPMKVGMSHLFVGVSIFVLVCRFLCLYLHMFVFLHLCLCICFCVDVSV